MKKDANLKIALIPAYQPDEKLVTLTKDIKKSGFYPVVVDDGSGKKYRKYFEEAKKYADVISYSENKGKGHALKTGIKHIKNKFEKEYTVVTIDSDGQHTVPDMLKTTDEAVANPESLVIGARQFDGKVPFRSRFGNSMTRKIFKMKTGAVVYDTQTGLRAFSDKLTDLMLSVEGSRYEYEMNMLLECACSGRKIIEVPIRTIYINDNEGSHFNPLRDSIKIYREIFKFKKHRRKK